MTALLPDIKVTDIDLDIVKDYLRVDFTEDDQLISMMVYAAKSFIQSYLNRKFSDWTYDDLPDEFTIACLAICTHWYETRSVSADRYQTKDELPFVFAGLLDMHRSFISETVLPDDVINLQAINVVGTSLTLSWAPSALAASYDIYQGTVLLGNTYSNTFNVAQLQPSTSYDFTVYAKNIAGSADGITITATTGAV